MKHILLLLFAFMLSGGYAVSQHNFGLKAGLNLSNQDKTILTATLNYPNQKQETKHLLGYQFGAFYKIFLNTKWTISAETNFSLTGSKTYYLTEQQILNPDGIIHYYNDKIGYIEVPLSLQYNLNNFYLGIGPSIAFKVFSKITNFENRTYNNTSYNTTDAMGNFLAGHKIAKKWDVNLRYAYGLRRIDKQPAFLETKNRFLNFSILYSLK